MDTKSYNYVINWENENTSHVKMLNMIGHNKTVLELGCCNGAFSEGLVNKGCTVTGVDHSKTALTDASKWLHDSYCLDLNDSNCFNFLGEKVFDVICFGDVLEHLINPVALLKAAKPYLSESGFMVISVPNMAHADVRLSLMMGYIPYQEIGLLDDSHLRWFNLENLIKLTNDAGLNIVELDRVTAKTKQTELKKYARKAPRWMYWWVKKKPEANTYQFVAKVK